MRTQEHSSCGVGFVASLRNDYSRENLDRGLRALTNLEHRGGSSPDGSSGDGAGILTDIPRRLLGLPEGDALAHLLLSGEMTSQFQALRIFQETFNHLGMEVYHLRKVPTDDSVLSVSGRATRPEFLMAFIRRPAQCTSRYAFEKLLYSAKQLTRSRLREEGIVKQFFFASLSAGTVVYKALLPSVKLANFYPDLQSEEFKTRFVLFHRRFSTNTATAWDTAQPFRVVAHNGEINTISGNRAWAYARERALGLRQDELLTHIGISDSGSVNEMIEALMFRSSIPHPEDIMAILMPQANNPHSFYKFWGRAMEPWDGPALFTYSDGRSVGARLDRNGFRPCRWAHTGEHFFLSSEAGSFEIPENEVLAKGSLSGGGSVRVNLRSGEFHFVDASQSRENRDATFDSRLTPLDRLSPPPNYRFNLGKLEVFNYTEEDLKKVLLPMLTEGREGIGSMGDTARLAALSSETRTLFDYFYQCFAQVTNPPLDYLREKLVTNMTSVIGRRPNIFEPKELLPLKSGIELPGPVLTLGQMEFLKSLTGKKGFEGPWPGAFIVDMTFPRERGIAGFRETLESLKLQVGNALKDRSSMLILSDRNASFERPPIPSVLLLSALVQGLNEGGMRLRTALVVETGEARSPHDVAVLIAFGAAAVCPYLPLELARQGHAALPVDENISPDVRELKCIGAFESGVLKIMSKMGVSVVRSYQASELFTILGLGPDVHKEFFPLHPSYVGGLSLEKLIERQLQNCSPNPLTSTRGETGLIHNYLYKEDPKQLKGEHHSMTILRTKLLHAAVRTDESKFQEYLKSSAEANPISFRHLLRPKRAEKPLSLDAIQSQEEILRTFGSGAMSFGAISAEAQRDIILAMREIGGRSNSGEGGENPYYFTDGITASVKQVASGRFGVTAEYLVAGNEIQIKIGQGAKPGEGGQLMAAKVDAAIARARHSEPGVDLISPPPMHDIYSIEDLKQLIYELRQLKPDCRISVKLVSGENIGTIAVGVAKAGADVIHIAGHDGGTGAAALGSMKHAGLPWELGISEVHRALSSQGVRNYLTLRVDGGLSTGRDIFIASVLGADEFDFGKLLLVAEGCIMARVCEKNTCPTGIATHDPKFKRLYRGTKDHVVKLLKLLAEDVRSELSAAGVKTLADLSGRSDLIEADPRHKKWIVERGINLEIFLQPTPAKGLATGNPYREPVSELNSKVMADVEAGQRELFYSIRPADRAALATLQGKKRSQELRFVFKGSAGQGFGVFLNERMNVRLIGEANDSVGKSMSGGRIVIVPSLEATFVPERNTILGNCALYGATGGALYVLGLAGNRFAVRNSGAMAVVEGVGMHACEYMTGGTVVVLGEVGANLGAGMSGGTLYIRKMFMERMNAEYVEPSSWEEGELVRLQVLLTDYEKETKSRTARDLLDSGLLESELVKLVPKGKALSHVMTHLTSGVVSATNEFGLGTNSSSPP